MNAVTIAPVVEGDGEVQAVPVLLRRLAGRLRPGTQVVVEKPVRCPRGKLIKPEELSRAVRLAAARVTSDGGVLIILDSDDDCPAQKALELLQCARAAVAVDVSVAMAVREFESWLLAGARGLGNKLIDEPDLPLNAESVRGAKERLRASLRNGKYHETVDQPSLTARFDLEQARGASPSFDKLCREVEHLIGSAM